MACTPLICGSGYIDLVDAIRNLITTDQNGCAGLEAVSDNVVCGDLTDLKDCGTSYTLADAFKAALTADDCGRYKLKIFDLTVRT